MISLLFKSPALYPQKNTPPQRGVFVIPLWLHLQRTTVEIQLDQNNHTACNNMRIKLLCAHQRLCKCEVDSFSCCCSQHVMTPALCCCSGFSGSMCVGSLYWQLLSLRMTEDRHKKKHATYCFCSQSGIRKQVLEQITGQTQARKMDT